MDYIPLHEVVEVNLMQEEHTKHPLSFAIVCTNKIQLISLRCSDAVSEMMWTQSYTDPERERALWMDAILNLASVQKQYLH